MTKAEAEVSAPLLASDRRLRNIISSLPGAVYQIGIARDGSLRLPYVSEGIEQLAGVSRVDAETDFQRLLGLVLREDLPVIERSVATLASGPQVLSTDYRIRHAKTGETRWVRAWVASLPRANDEVLCHGFWQDITEIKNLEAEAVAVRTQRDQTERRLHDIIANIPGAVYQFRALPDGRYETTYMSPGAVALAGITYCENSARLTEAVMSVMADDTTEMHEETQRAARELAPLRCEFRIRHAATGELRWIRTMGTPQRQDDGSTVFNGFWQDVTDARELDAALAAARESADGAQQRLRTIFDNTRIGLVMIAEDGTFSGANPSLRELLDIEDEQEFARDFRAFSPPLQPDGRPSMEKAEEVIKVAFERGYNRFDWMHQTRAGQPRPCEVALTRVELGGRPQIFATMTDLRERVNHEAELRKATEKAHAASKAKSEFLANMSHEIRTPLNAIVGLTHLGLTATEPERLRDYLGKIDGAARSLLRIVNDILDFSKIEAGKLQLESMPFDLVGVLDRLGDLMNVPAAMKSLTLLFAVEPGLPSQLVGDPLRLGQVLLNLTGNAIKFTDAGRVVVSVKVAKRGRDFVRLRFEVTDTGVGLTHEQITKLFESFSQADTSTTRRYGGTGLGLAISQRLVDLMDGEIVVTSDPGRGSTFSFSARFGLAPYAVRSATPRAEPTLLEGRRVLLVEDNEINQEVARELLQRAGMTVDLATNGHEAIARAADADYDAILMDVQMPLMDGIEATRRIRALDSPRATVPIVAMTANAMAEDRQRCLDAGMNDHLGKPVDVELLNAVLTRWIVPPGSPAASAGNSASVSVAMIDFDFDSAIRQMAGLRRLWENAARRYLASPPAPARIVEHCLVGDREAAFREAHTLKGIAAALGLLALQRASANTERQLADAHGAGDKELRRLAEIDAAARCKILQYLETGGNVP